MAAVGTGDGVPGVSWLTAAWAYLLASLRPMRRFNALTQEIGLPVFVVVIFFWLRANQGWARALVFALGILVVLLLVEGARREHAERSLTLVFEPVASERMPPDPAVEHPLWKVSVKVTNRAGDRRFIARCDGGVEGLAAETPASDFSFAWEGRPEEEYLLRTDAPVYVNIGYFQLGVVRFLMPETVYSTTGQSVGPSKIVKDPEVRFVLELRPAEGIGRVREQVVIAVTQDDVPPPQVSLSGP
jgi:hypothetical protein